MTHEHQMDEDILAAIQVFPTRYIGLIGSQTKWERFRLRLSHRGISAAQLEKVSSPLGLPLGGGKAPKEVAISLAAELLKVYYSDSHSPVK
jgi:xanthine dehydrogenase accessory factor